MKFTCSIPLLRSKLETVQNGVPTKSVMPILRTVLLTCERGTETVTLKTTDLEIGITARFLARVEQSGSVALPFHKLMDCVSNLGDGDIVVSLDAKNNAVILTANGHTLTIKGLETKDFPNIDKPVETTRTFSIPTAQLVNALTRTMFSAAPDEARAVLNSVLFHVENQKLTLVTFDVFRMSVVNSMDAATEDVNFLVKLSNAQKVVKIARGMDKEGLVTISISDAKAFFVWDTIEISAQLVEGNFIDYRAALKNLNTHATDISVPRTSLKRALDIANVFAREHNDIVDFNADADKKRLEIVARSAESGESNGAIEAEIIGESLDFGLNGKYLEQFVSACTADELAMRIVKRYDELSKKEVVATIVFQEVDNPDFTHFCAPFSR